MRWRTVERGCEEFPIVRFFPIEFAAGIDALFWSALVHLFRFPGTVGRRTGVLMRVLWPGLAKMFLAPPPRGCGARDKPNVHFDLWHDGGFAELLSRADEQHCVHLQARQAQRGRSQRNQGVGCGFRRVHTAGPCCRFDACRSECWPCFYLSVLGRSRQGWHSPLQGVRFSALTAFGLSGLRVEHLKDVLGVRRCHVCGRVNFALLPL